MPIEIPDQEKYLELKYQRMARIVDAKMSRVTDPIIKKVYKKFGVNIFRRCSAPADYSEKVFKDTMGHGKFVSALEIGTLNGITAAVMSQYVDKVYTFDIEDYDKKYEIWEYLGVRDKIKFYKINNELEKADIINKLYFDIAYIDGDHLHCTWSDFFLTRKCKHCIIHEATLESSEPWKLVQALPKKQVKYFKFAFIKECTIAYWNGE